MIRKRRLLIDLSSSPSGGGLRHIRELIKYSSSTEVDRFFDVIILFGSKSTLNNITVNGQIFSKKSSWLLNYSGLGKFVWKLFFAERCFIANADMVFDPFGTFYSKRIRYITMSQNMLYFSRIEASRFDTLYYYKLLLVGHVQRKAFNNSEGIIFLSEYAKREISKQCYGIKSSIIIPHGIDDIFRQHYSNKYRLGKTCKILFVSSIWPYKHPWNVVEACSLLKEYGIELTIVGNAPYKSSRKKLQKSISKNNREISIRWFEDVGLDSIVKFYHEADIFIFSSSCENMPNILIEAMASSLPIICSNYSPMPSFLKDAGVYFDPLDIIDLKNKIEEVILNDNLRLNLASKAYEYSLDYSWKKCATDTFSYLIRKI